MDSMESSWSHPQEDEFALANMGLPSPYCRIAFPNHEDPFPEYLTLESVSERERAIWQSKWLSFLRRVASRGPGRRLILKSPPHTARLRTILRIFPEAKFVHLVRDPCEIFPSTMNLWRRLYAGHGYQTPHFKDLERYILRTLTRMYVHYEQGRQALRPGQICEIRYEDLVEEPLVQLEYIYDHLDLGDFDDAEASVAAYLERQADYIPARHSLTDRQRRRIEMEWASYFETYEYAGAESTP
jgi:hypothetical protein